MSVASILWPTRKTLGLYLSKVIFNKWKETVEFLEEVLILIANCSDGNELGLEVRFSLWKALNINAGRGRGWCLHCHTLCFGLVWAPVPRAAGQRWGQEDKPMSPNPYLVVGSSGGIPTECGLCFSCCLRERAQIHEVTFSLLFLWAYKGFSLFPFQFSWGLCQHKTPTAHNGDKLMGHSNLTETVAKAPCLGFLESLGASQGDWITSLWLVNLLLPFCSTHSNTEA